MNCPICDASSFAAADTTFDLAAILAMWRDGARVQFAPEVWDQYQGQQVQLFSCRVCEFSLFVPPLAGSTGFYAAITADEGQYYVGDKWEFLQAIRTIQQHGCQRILDVGSGSGHFLEILKRRQPALYAAGYELNSDAAALARSRGHAVSDGPFPQVVLDANVGQPFDAVCAFQVLEHLADPAAFFEEVKQLLKPGGLLILGVPDLAGPVRYFQFEPTNIPPHHVSWWTETTFRQGAPRFGFGVLQVSKEPLPDYLWKIYIPVIVEHQLRPRRLARYINRTGLLLQLLQFLKRRAGLRALHGVPGHTLYVVLQLEA